ncbi:MAG TPA: SDR family oxidoreductase [Chitinophagales bacterium]|nr:SDR family oxidoreductase [Chitinophagales bacterium]HMX03541.1 SDR family oxidoreductase [Chitinophagales bacterium]HMZ87888.1 SDR family oxidoreductase [Chitinophagales bacterium]HNE45864.1 SDR family oxidoreductase [Chitinophagales bacterium]HNF67981.1 SDR family oxidoreductase [Chitinophagales bacterium]
MYNQPMLPAQTFTSKVIIVTGGGTGLGKSMTRYFLELGATVIITSRKIEVLSKTAEELSAATGSTCIPIVCDVRDYDAVEHMLQSAIEKCGKVDMLVNNAAGNFISPTERLSHRAFDSVVDIVLKGTYNCTLACGKYWIENKLSASVLNIVTTYSWTGSGYVVPSACGKAGVLALTRSLAVEWGKYHIRLNAIAPGPFPTEGAWSRLVPPGMEDDFDMAKKNAVGRLGEHQELANLAAYLLSDFAAFMTGEVVVIDGAEWLKGAGEFNMLDKLPTQLWDMMELMRKERGERREERE